jgi:hypothetical protein
LARAVFRDDIFKKSVSLQQLLLLSRGGPSTTGSKRVKVFPALAWEKRLFSWIRMSR